MTQELTQLGFSVCPSEANYLLFSAPVGLDAALLLLWLACAIFRMGFLCTAVCQIGRRLLPEAEKGGQQA